MNNLAYKMPLTTFNDNNTAKFPRTRYQGSKSKIVDWIIESSNSLEINTILDSFGGTGVVGYNFKKLGKKVVYNDIMTFNSMIATAIIENKDTYLSDDEIDELLYSEANDCPTFIQDNYKKIYYLDEENKWLDEMVYKINKMTDKYKQSIAWFAVIQSCIIKRPYNLFHRANLYVRTANVKRSFGNKITWDKPFEIYFRQFVHEANEAIFDNNKENIVLNQDATNINPKDYGIDTVYIDTPYISAKGVGTDYYDFYGFLEGMMDYNNWDKKILSSYKHKPIIGKGNKEWTGKNEIFDSFDKLFARYKDQQLIISYRNDGVPSISELKEILSKYKSDVYKVSSMDYKYVLSTRKTKEVLIIAK